MVNHNWKNPESKLHLLWHCEHSIIYIPTSKKLLREHSSNTHIHRKFSLKFLVVVILDICVPFGLWTPRTHWAHLKLGTRKVSQNSFFVNVHVWKTVLNGASCSVSLISMLCHVSCGHSVPCWCFFVFSVFLLVGSSVLSPWVITDQLEAWGHPWPIWREKILVERSKFRAEWKCWYFSLSVIVVVIGQMRQMGWRYAIKCSIIKSLGD